MNLLKIALFALSPFFSCSQISLKPNNQREIYLGMQSRFTIMGQFDSTQIKIHSSNGNFEIEGAYLKVNPSQSGSLVLSIYKLQEKDSTLVYSQKFWVTALPDPIPTIYQRTKTVLSLNAILHSEIKLDLPSPPMVCTSGLHFPVKNYKVLVLRDNQLIAYSFNEGSKNTAKTKAALGRAQRGDRVLFFDIVGMNAYKKNVTLATIEIDVD